MASMDGTAQRGWRPPRAKSNRFRNIAILAAIVGAVLASPVGAGIFIVAMISVIGIPIALLVAAIPTLCLFIVLAYAAYRFGKFSGTAGTVAAFAIAGAAMVVFPQIHNAEIRWKVAKLIAEDRTPDNFAAVSGAGEVPALGVALRHGARNLCSETCVHLLIRGQVRSVLIANLDEGASRPDFGARAFVNRLERGADCKQGRVRLNSFHVRDRKPGTVAAAYLDLKDKGYCITTSEATLRDADSVVMTLDQRYFPKPWTVSPIASEIKGSRMAYYVRNESGLFDVAWQETRLSYSLLGPVLAHAFSGGAELRMDTGWWRKDVRPQSRYRSQLDFMRDVIGFDLPEDFR